MTAMKNMKNKKEGVKKKGGEKRRRDDDYDDDDNDDDNNDDDNDVDKIFDVANMTLMLVMNSKEYWRVMESDSIWCDSSMISP